MKIQSSSPRPQAGKAAPSAPSEKPAASPRDSVQISRQQPPPEPPRFQESGRRWQRDALVGASGVASCLLPGVAGKGTGVAFGALTGVTGLGELHEGVSRGDVHEALDGALHLVAGGGLVAAGLSHGTALAPFLAAGSAAVLLAKGAYDSPGPLLKSVARESKGLALDSGRSIAQGAVAGWHALFPPAGKDPEKPHR